MAAIPFFSADWAQAARTAINEGPDPATVERKVEGFWNWIERAQGQRQLHARPGGARPARRPRRTPSCWSWSAAHAPASA